MREGGGCAPNLGCSGILGNHNLGKRGSLMSQGKTESSHFRRPRMMVSEGCLCVWIAAIQGKWGIYCSIGDIVLWIIRIVGRGKVGKISTIDF